MLTIQQVVIAILVWLVASAGLGRPVYRQQQRNISSYIQRVYVYAENGSVAFVVPEIGIGFCQRMQGPTAALAYMSTYLATGGVTIGALIGLRDVVSFSKTKSLPNQRRSVS